MLIFLFCMINRKYEEINPPHVAELSDMVERTYNKAEVLALFALNGLDRYMRL